MKTRTAAFDAAWSDKRTRFAVYRVEIKRRYWNGSAFVLESTAQVLRPKDISRVGTITQRFDSLQAQISVSNITLVLKNLDWVWLPSNITTGKWAPDATATLGYDPMKTQVVIYYGYTLGDGTDELIELFTGIVNDDPVYDTKSGTVSFTVIGQAEQKLADADAQNVCTTLSDQATDPTTGNSVLTLFSTALKSLWSVINVRAGAAVKTQGDSADYTLTDLNDPEVAAGIQFTDTSVPGAVAILFDGKQWYRNKTIKELAELLCEESGIGSGDREIEDAVFPGVDQTHLIDTADDMAASTLTGMEITSEPGMTKHGLDLCGNLGADMSSAGPGTSGFSGDGTHAYDFYSLSSDIVSLTESHYLRVTLTPGAGATITKDFTSESNGYVTDYIDAASDGPYTMKFELRRTSDNVVHETVNYAKSIASGSRVTLVYGRGTYYGVSSGGIILNGIKIYIASRSIPPTGNVKFPEIDTVVAPVSWLALASSINLNGGTATIYTKSGTVSGVYDARVALSSGVPASSLKRYVVIEVDTTPAAALDTGPSIDSVALNWRGSNLFIGSADWTGKTCLEAMQDLAELGGMEYGTKSLGKFFLRNKTVSGSADLTISQKDVVLEVQSFTLGYKEVANVGQVTYGSSGNAGYYFAEYGATEAGEAHPTSAERFGARPIQLQISNLVFSQGAQVASAIAQKLYTLNYLPKRRARVLCRIIPHLEISDKVSLSFHDSPLIESQIFGDPMQVRPAMGALNTLARDILMKVVGKTDDVEKSQTILDLEEILS